MEKLDKGIIFAQYLIRANAVHAKDSVQRLCMALAYGQILPELAMDYLLVITEKHGNIS
jgi:hypothetical protein